MNILFNLDVHDSTFVKLIQIYRTRLAPGRRIMASIILLCTVCQLKWCINILLLPIFYSFSFCNVVSLVKYLLSTGQYGLENVSKDHCQCYHVDFHFHWLQSPDAHVFGGWPYFPRSIKWHFRDWILFSHHVVSCLWIPHNLREKLSLCCTSTPSMVFSVTYYLELRICCNIILLM